MYIGKWGTGSAAAGPQEKGNHNEDNNYITFECPTNAENTARKTSASHAAPGITLNIIYSFDHHTSGRT